MQKKNGDQNIPSYQAILFDLDGTLIDSAYDLTEAANLQLQIYQRPKKSVNELRQYVTHGSTKLIEVAFEHNYPKSFDVLREEFLAIYKTVCTKNLIYFEGIKHLLTSIEQSNIPWGIVTNKATFLTEIIVDKLKLNNRASVVICGDTLPVAKPDPSPVLLACKVLGVDPKQCIFIGDSIKDITAGKLAEMPTIACAYGYLHQSENANQWEATYIANKPTDLALLLSLPIS